MAENRGTPRRKPKNKVETGSANKDKNKQQPLAPPSTPPTPTPKRRPINPDRNRNISSVRSFPSIDNRFNLDDRDFEQTKMLMANIVASLPQHHSSKYAAFLLAGFTGCKEDCDQLVREYDMEKLILKAQNSAFKIIESEEKCYSKLREDTVCTIETALAKGMTTANACYLAGIIPLTLDNWLNKGREDSVNGEFGTNCAKVLYRISRAKPKGELVLLDTIHDAALGRSLTEDKVETQDGIVPVHKRIRITKRQWQAAAWILERTRREHYGKDAKIDDNSKVSASEEAEGIMQALDMLINNQVENLEELTEGSEE